MEEEVIEKPDVPDAVIFKALEDCYAIQATQLEFVPRGLDARAWAYRAQAEPQDYFVKVSKGRVDESGAWAPMFLAQQGLPEVIAPLPTRNGDVLGRVDDLTLRVEPFVPGERAMDAGMSPQLWAQLGRFLGRLHKLQLSEAVRGRVRREVFLVRRLEWVEDVQRRIESVVGQDAISAEFLAFWQDRRASIAALIGRAITLRQAAQRESWQFVLCHGDIHSGNLLLAKDGSLYVVDWDDMILAPRERDLMFVLAEMPAEAEAEFFAAYRGEAVNPLALAYYRHDWCIEDIGAFGVEILDSNAGEETRLNDLHWFKTLFGQGGSVPTALAPALQDWPV